MRQTCRNCMYYERILGVRQGYCRSPQSYYYDCKRQGGDKGADRCYIPYTEKQRSILKPKKDKEE